MKKLLLLLSMLFFNATGMNNADEQNFSHEQIKNNVEDFKKAVVANCDCEVKELLETAPIHCKANWICEGFCFSLQHRAYTVATYLLATYPHLLYNNKNCIKKISLLNFDKQGTSVLHKVLYDGQLVIAKFLVENNIAFFQPHFDVDQDNNVCVVYPWNIIQTFCSSKTIEKDVDCLGGEKELLLLREIVVSLFNANFNVYKHLYPMAIAQNFHTVPDNVAGIWNEIEQLCKILSKMSDLNRVKIFTLFLQNDKNDFKKLIQKFGPSLCEIFDNNGKTLLHLTCEKGWFDLGLFLIKQGVRTQVFTPNRILPVHMVATVPCYAPNIALLYKQRANLVQMFNQKRPAGSFFMHAPVNQYSITECCICAKEFDQAKNSVVTLPCGHLYCSNCFTTGTQSQDSTLWAIGHRASDGDVLLMCPFCKVVSAYHDIQYCDIPPIIEKDEEEK